MIKALEGFRPRAEHLPDGRWVIGHGHTLSAREGAQVGADEAELLLQYDLLPVLNVISRQAEVSLNRHQIDALASYGLSIGAEGLAESEVMGRLNDGDLEGAALALTQSEAAIIRPPAPSPTARRRAAEGAMFGHDPDHDPDLALLLAAPVETEFQGVGAVEEQARDARAEALAHLLGETARADDQHEANEAAVVIPAFGPSTLVSDPDLEAGVEATDEAFAPLIGPLPANENGTAGVALERPAAPVAEAAAIAMALRRYMPYGIAAAGPLPELSRPAPASPPDEQAAPLLREAALPYVQQLDITAVTPSSVPDAVQADTGSPEEAEGQPAAEPEQTMAVLADDAQAGRVDLILTSPSAEEPETPRREVWAETERHGVNLDEEPLFIEDPALRGGAAPVFRPEGFDPEPRGRIDWNDTGAFLGMGAVGLAAFGAAIVGFRVGADRSIASGIDQTAVVAWILALIGALCVGVSAYNLARRWTARRNN